MNEGILPWDLYTLSHADGDIQDLGGFKQSKTLRSFQRIFHISEENRKAHHLDRIQELDEGSISLKMRTKEAYRFKSAVHGDQKRVIHFFQNSSLSHDLLHLVV